MKPILLFCVLVFASSLVLAQNSSARGEFANQPNGLMYNDHDMKILRRMVDSLNLRFKSCDLSQAYYSVPQTRAYSVIFSSKSNDLLKVKSDLDKNMNFSELTRKYANLVQSIDTNKLFVCFSEADEDGKRYCLEGTPGKGYESANSLSEDPATMMNKWSYEYNKKGEYTSFYSLECTFFPYPFISHPIPNPFARLIQYVDCMIDTSSSVMLARGWPDRPRNDSNQVLLSLKKYINSKMGKPVLTTDGYWSLLTAEETHYADQNLKQDPEFLSLLNNLVNDCVKHNYGDEELESLVSNCISKTKALELKRSRIVVGQCSQDLSPRMHALEIALLAAETHSWEIFLRAHLDIMNDRFVRAIDGSYAWEDRKTYLKELEEMNLNVVDLMLGMTLRADNVAPNHYYGTVWRTGWALTESREKERFESAVFSALKDESLDEFNRGLIFLLYNSYLVRLENHDEIVKKIEFIKAQSADFPAFLRPHILALAPPSKEKKK